VTFSGAQEGGNVTTHTVSVVIPAYRAAGTIAAVLEGLRRQHSDHETIVVDSSPDRHTESIVHDSFREVRLIRSEARLGAGDARNVGAAGARGELIVFLDADCAPGDGWLATLTGPALRGEAIVGGGIAPAGEGWLERGMHLCKFSAWLPGGPRGGRDQLPSASLCLTRAAWERFGPFRSRGWAEDSGLSWRAREAGVERRFEPEAVVRHAHRQGFRAFLAERIERGEAEGRLRPKVEGWGRGRLVAYLVSLPLVPFVAAGRNLVWAARSGELPRALAVTPVLLAGWTAWSLGEARSHLRLLTRP
jgi:GT2 family glycosyltransferase